jgi:hypothetical protein
LGVVAAGTRFAEIKMRAIIKIGELSRELEKTNERSHDKSSKFTSLPNGRKSGKAKALKEAGIPVSTAQWRNQRSNKVRLVQGTSRSTIPGGILVVRLHFRTAIS